MVFNKLHYHFLTLLLNHFTLLLKHPLPLDQSTSQELGAAIKGKALRVHSPACLLPAPSHRRDVLSFGKQRVHTRRTWGTGAGYSAITAGHPLGKTCP